VNHKSIKDQFWDWLVETKKVGDEFSLPEVKVSIDATGRQLNHAVYEFRGLGIVNTKVRACRGKCAVYEVLDLSAPPPKAAYPRDVYTVGGDSAKLMRLMGYGVRV